MNLVYEDDSSANIEDRHMTNFARIDRERHEREPPPRWPEY
jgi:hypothetical protein